jgi:hypothetical protein
VVPQTWKTGGDGPVSVLSRVATLIPARAEDEAIEAIEAIEAVKRGVEFVVIPCLRVYSLQDHILYFGGVEIMCAENCYDVPCTPFHA